jgi:leader peptidase (prepilin peptidase) / N-methyltransferase
MVFMPVLSILSAALFGAILGSWLATIVIRWPQGISASHGRSRCDGCATPISAKHLIPIVSFFYLRGKCAQCGAAISPLHVQMEIACAVILASAVAFWPLPNALTFGLFALQIAVLIMLDFRHFWLPDRVNALLAVTGLAFAQYMPFPVAIEERVLGGIAGFLALYLVAAAYKYMRGHDGLGAGDPKMLGAVGCWLGLLALPYVILGAASMGIAVALGMRIMGKAVTHDTQLPLGSLIGISALVIAAAGLV